MTRTDRPRVGFETIGNATIIAYDQGPVLATDPWITESAYFGSWGHSHEIPDAQRAAIKTCPFIWFSHGHPDHLNGESLPQFAGRQILLPDHVGGRIKLDLEKQGFAVRVLPNREWIALSPRIRVLCLADYNQDSILLIDVNGRLLVNYNDAGNRGWESFVKRVVSGFKHTFLLALSGYGDADMINFFDEQGRRVPPLAARRFPVGAAIAKRVEAFGCRSFVPSSSMHRYQRADAVWANEFTTPLADLEVGFASETARLLPAFISYDCESDEYVRLEPKRRPELVLTPESFGDRWTDPLERGELERAGSYFKSIAHLSTFLDHVTLRVGGKDHAIALSKQPRFGRGVTFEAPRVSLMTAIDYAIFDDLLIGNFMKTTLHGRWPLSGLYPDFSPYVAKYSDNGGARTQEELAVYFEEYRRRAPMLFLRHALEEKAKNVLRTYVPADSATFQRMKRLYWDMKRMF